MGLDMYLYRQRPGESVEGWQDDFENNTDWENDPDPWSEYDAWKKDHEVAYWRKANAIHKWFVDTCQDGVDECQFSEPIGREALAGLVQRCRDILAGKRDGSEGLPTQVGFFFGTYEYDEWYDRDLKETIEQLEPLLAERNGDVFIYHSSWLRRSSERKRHDEGAATSAARPDGTAASREARPNAAVEAMPVRR